MSSLILQTRYAKSLFDLACELDQAAKVYNDMLLIYKACTDNRLLRAILKNPTIKPLKKRSILKEIFADKVTEITMKFLNLLSAKRRDVYLMEISERYIKIYKEHIGIKTVHLTIAEPVSDNIRNQIISTLKQELHSEIELLEKISPNIIGGFTLKVEDKLYDASISQSISILKQAFSKNIYQGSL
ncbi:MAG: ATP synthase F1 subunit delta [Bacteroidales bacterium]|jgi:F-type H+-transporting ATPase subunit delta|nr:ATP synthase F1 subunit delta [Bacteroidales bacterium]